MGRLGTSDYEDLRNARILENQARMASLGLHKTASELRSIASSVKPTNLRKHSKKDYTLTPLRRSVRLKHSDHRLKHSSTATTNKRPNRVSLRRSYRLRGKEGGVSEESVEESEESYGTTPSSEERRPANMPLVKLGGLELQLSPEYSAHRCNSKGRGSLYDPVYGICCHFCRQKKLCGEEDCKRCSDLDMDEPCIGKTDCSACHSSNGVLCRACLMVRYGEEMDEVRKDKEWMCPHCVEEKGINPYWICNSSLCLRKRKMVPTGIAIFRAREMGYKSVAHLLMDELQRTNKVIA
ncbi:uncharacterized protein LOC126703180 isoform X1 [Quercus robur]|uniref:uncharacterized protein LOC126703180 isoform X1 n=1 Tax=Quercus robur TaxID=38942 RepID=UPI002162959F|nr:uncharacterized protein LOC126703180 isoform X1 [Quercus robur]